MESNYVRADNSNLPKIDAFMVALFFKNNADYYAAKPKNVKAAVTTAYPSDPQDYPLQSSEEDTYSTEMTQMGKNLDELPQGYFEVISANFAYNDIQELATYAFYVKLYKNLQKIELGHNRISKVSVEAFKELRQLNTVDLSSNNLSYLEPNTFRHNPKFQKLDLAFNRIIFDPEKPFLRSHSLETLVMSSNQITHIFDITLARLPRIHTLLLDSNSLYYLSPNCFVHLRNLKYVSLANTGVHRLTESMFKVVPRLVDLTGTTLANKFEPPLRKVRSTQLVKLIDIEKYVLDDDYDT